MRLLRKAEIMTVRLIPLKDLTALENVQRFSVRRPHNLEPIKRSITDNGLLNPLIVMKQNNRYQVLDGKKRLKVIRQLVKANKQTRALNKIPCVIQENPEHVIVEPRRPTLITGPELAHAIITQMDLGLPPISVAQRFECDYSVIDDAMSLKKLHPTMLEHFNNRAISLEQASAFATIPNPEAQLSLLEQLGPFVSNEKIIAAIKTGETVIEVPNGEVVILPSRQTAPAPLAQTNRHNNMNHLIAAA